MNVEQKTLYLHNAQQTKTLKRGNNVRRMQSDIKAVYKSWTITIKEEGGWAGASTSSIVGGWRVVV